MLSFRTIIHRSLFSSGDLLPGEGRSAFVASIMHGLVLGGWYFARPIRDEISSHQNEHLAKLQTATFVVMLIVAPVYAYLVKHLTRRTVLPTVYLFFAAMLATFWALLTHGPQSWHTWIERAFVVISSVLNVFLLSVFWGLMADVFTQPQAKRSFGVIAAGGSLGGVVGSFMQITMSDPPESMPWLKLEAKTMFLVTAAIFALVPLFMFGIRTSDPSDAPHDRGSPDAPISGTTWSILIAPFRSPYLLGVCAYMFVYTLTSTFLYFQQSVILEGAIADRAARRALLARMDFWVNIFSFIAQFLLAAHAMRKLGIAITLSITPIVSAGGFIALIFAPTLWPIVIVQVTRRIANFGFARPSREVLFTIVPREDKYKAKAFIDTAIYRGGDTASGWAFEGLKKMGLALGGIAAVGAAVSAVWVAIAWLLGRAHHRAVARGNLHVEPRGFDVGLKS